MKFSYALGNLVGIPTLRDAMKRSNQAWVWHGNKWQLHQGFDTVVMELYLKDKLDCPAIPVDKPEDLDAQHR